MAVLVTAGSAFAAGGGYGPTTVASNGAPGGFSTVAASKVIGPAGGTVAATVAGGTVTVTVPAGAFSASDDVVVTSPDLAQTNAGLSAVGFAGYDAVAGAGVSVLDSSGSPVTATFAQPVTVTIAGSSVGTSGEKVLSLTGPASAVVVPAALGAGSVSVQVSSDPDLVAVNPTVSATTPAAAPSVPAATSQHTGLPFTGETDAAYSLAGVGIVALGAAGMRRRRATTAR
ncbi:MAG: hypothetical protein ACYDEN_12275 [Acidimicrobiales bacterium]